LNYHNSNKSIAMIGNTQRRSRYSETQEGPVKAASLNRVIMIAALGLVTLSCSPPPVGEQIASSLGVKDDPRSPFYIPVESLPRPGEDGFSRLPIGVFDSGTGGLTVLEAMLTRDLFDNRRGVRLQGGDGIPDFLNEGFIYLGDMANMPYGNYPAVGRTDFLRELCIKDAAFLLGTWFHLPDNYPARSRKSSVKCIVIACNTSTAYGKTAIQEMIEYLGLEIDVIGVIDAGAEGALECFGDGGNGTIGVFATVGTVMSGSYPETIRKLARKRGIEGKIDIIQQGGFGIAGAIDGNRDFIDPGYRESEPRNGYLGPSLHNAKYPIKRELLPLYNFSTAGNELIQQRDDRGRLVEIQLNSVRNYVRYHVTDFLVKLKERKAVPPLRAIILGCTHYPYVACEIAVHLDYLANFKNSDGHRPFAGYLDGKVALVDPAKLTADKTWLSLFRRGILGRRKNPTREFYISIPNKHLAGVVVDSRESFTYDYKYGREAFFRSPDGASRPPEYVLRVPMCWNSLGQEAVERIRRRLPATYHALAEFNGRSICR